MSSEWISVEERMPEPFVNVLAYCKSLGYRVEANWNGQKWTPTGNQFCAEITHWMPWPEPPKKQAPDAFEAFCENHFCAQSREVMVIPDGKGAHYTVGKHTARYIWDAAVKATTQSSGEQISKEDARVLANAIKAVHDWSVSDEAYPTQKIVRTLNRAMNKAKQLGLCH